MNETNPSGALSPPEDLSAGNAGRAALGSRHLIFIGLMGSGKSAIGKLVAQWLNLTFVDTDIEIERVSRMTISELFAAYGENEFRALEARVVKRLLHGESKVVSTGGGAFINEECRAYIRQGGLSLWLKADLEVLWERVRKRDHRPLLKTENPKVTLQALMEKRYPIYAQADMTVETHDVRKEIIANEVLATLAKRATGELGR